MTALAKFFRLKPSERRLVMAAALWLGAVKMALWMLPFSAVDRATARLSTPRAEPLERSQETGDRIAWAISAVSRTMPVVDNCLVRAVAARVMLGRRGYSSELKFGVVKGSEGALSAHAWLESGGRVLIGAFEPGRYSPLADPPRRASAFGPLPGRGIESEIKPGRD